MLGRRVHISPSFQLSELLRNSIRNQRVIAPQALLVRYWSPIIRGIGTPIISGSGIFRKVEYC